MSRISEDYEPNPKKPKIDTEKNKKVKFGFVETKYYERRAGFVTIELEIQIAAGYNPYATSRTYFNEHDSSTCGDCILKRQEAQLEYDTNVATNKEKMNDFYNIHGLTTKRKSASWLDEKKRLRLLIQAGVEREEIKKSIVEQSENDISNTQNIKAIDSNLESEVVKN